LKPKKHKLFHKPKSKNTNITKRESIITRNIDITILILLVILIHQVSQTEKRNIIIISTLKPKLRRQRKLRHNQLQSKRKKIKFKL
jgi:hypothetical protein